MALAHTLSRPWSVRIALVLVAATGAVPASASTLALTDTIYSPTAANSYSLVTASGQDPTLYATVDPTLAYTLSGNQFNGAGQLATTFNFGSAATSSGGPWNFQDSYNFVTPTSAQASSAVISIGSTIPAGLSNLQIRIINGATVSAATPQLGAPTNGVVTGDGWTSYNFANGSYSFTLPAGLTAGNDYILQVRGEATTSASSSYGGTLTFTAVPLPASLPMLLSGLAGLGLVGARRRRAA